MKQAPAPSPQFGSEPQPQPKPRPSPSVTVGIPFYNAEATLADAIRSVFVQTLTDWELILVDDGSTDGSLEVARSVYDSRVRVISDGRNLGLAARLNQIAQLARGGYLARMDADDMMHRVRLAVQAEFLDRNPAVDVVGTGMYILDIEGRPVAKRLRRAVPFTTKQALMGVNLVHATILGRVDWFRRNAYDPSFRIAQDYEMWCRTCGESHFASLPDCYYFYTEHASFSLPKYAASAWSVARAQREHGVRLLGYLPGFALCVRQLGKIAVYAAARAVGAHGRLIARRSAALSPTEIEQAAAEVARIRATPLPLHRGSSRGDSA